ncbi:MAG: NAD(P)-dependent alcohol dehydrogenase [Pseudomonadota bacterium]
MPTEVTAAVCDPERGRDTVPQLERLTLRDPGPHEIRVRIKAVGICHTDFFAGSLSSGPVVPGHEGAGIVEAVGAQVTRVAVGDRVGLTFDSCGACPRCDANDPAYCHDALQLQFGLDESMERADGTAVAGAFFKQSSFATHALASERNAIRLPSDLPFDLAAPLGCGVQTGYGGVVNSLQPKPGENIVIFGLGAVGLSAVIAAQHAGLSTIVGIDPIAERRALAEEFGATHTFAPDTALDAAIAPRSADYTLDCAGTEQTFTQAITLLKPRGRCGIIAVPPPDKPISFVPLNLLDGGREVVGIVEGGSDPDQFLPMLGKRVLDGSLPLERMIKRYTFENFGQAWEDAKSGKTIKPVLIMQEA